MEGFGCYLLLPSGGISEGQKIRTMKCFFHGSCSFWLPLAMRERHIALKEFPDKETSGIISQAVKEVRRKLRSDGVVTFLCQYGSEH